MKKRYNILAAILIVSMFSLGGRIFYISHYNAFAVAALKSSNAEVYGTKRGLIFDRNMNKLVETQSETKTSVSNKKFSFSVAKRYSDNQLCAHFIGYTDTENNGVSGIEKDENEFLKSIKNEITIKTFTDAKGRILEGKGTNIDTSNLCENSGVKLTVDKIIQQSVEKYGTSLKKGAVIVMNSDTAEILAGASFPTFNPNKIGEYIDDENMPFLNRILCNYNVGSVFKTVICMAALENGIDESFSYVCTGKTNCGGVIFNCHKADGHGKINMKQAVAHSCNTYFIELAKRVGAKKIIDMCKKLEIEKPISLSKTITAAAGNLPDIYDLSSPAVLANLSFGQGELLSSPLELCRIYTVIANGGILNEPSLILGKIEKGDLTAASGAASKRVISSSTAKKIKSFLEYTVLNGTGKNAAVKNLSVAGKTATAQTGKFKGNKEILISYFIGIFSIKGDNYTILVMCEDGSSGSTDCAPIFKSICEDILKM